MLVRVIVGVVTAAVAIALLLLGGWFLWGLVALVAVLSVHELSLALNTRLCAKIPVYAFAALFVPVRVLLDEHALLVLLVICVLAALVPFAIGGGAGGRNPMSQIFNGLFPFVYPLLFLYAALQLILLSGSNYITMFLLAAGCPLVSDVFALFGGKLFGKRKLLPRVSPNKTVEGALFGLVGGAVAGGLVYVLIPSWLETFTVFAFPVLGLILSAAGQAGDLFASAIKRHCGIKDFGRILPGHGGVLDRVDSVLFCAPVVYIVLVSYMSYFYMIFRF